MKLLARDLFEHVFKRPMPLLERNRKQAEVPNVCTVLKNEMERRGECYLKRMKKFYQYASVPHEMKGIMNDHVLPLLNNVFNCHILGRTVNGSRRVFF
jgi:nicotinamide-nucleotide amidase